ncbi:MAG TPA: hypothetical protein VFP13_05160 [Actinomycetota bacterium]|nr:hypothetical protein [Actinomycetota bacterium]
MIAVGIWLVAVGLADLVAGLSGEPKAGPRLIGAIVAGTTAPAVLCVLAGADAATAVLLTAVTGVTVAGWLVLRLGTPSISALRALAALGFVVAAFVVVSLLGSEPVASFEGESVLERGIGILPFPTIAGASLERFVFVAGVLAMLFATSNAIVRLVLTAMGTRFSNAEQRLRGGRVIGPLERILIFGLGLAGQATAAALVIGAKGLLRYPELNNLRGEQGAGGTTARPIDVVTEYLLIGSLTSWLLALFPLVLVP